MICTTPPNRRAMVADELARRAQAAGIDATAAAEPLAALEQAEQLAGDAPLLVGGSFYLCGELRPALQKRHFGG